MSEAAPTKRAIDTARRTGALTVGLVAAGIAALMLLTMTFVTQTQSYDTMLYARSLWGVAHGDLQNTVYGTHVFGVHAQLGLLVLAPLALLWHPATVLVLAQCAAFAATLAMGGTAIARAVPTRTVASALGAGLAGALLLAMSPLLANPFFFDARPDLLAVPLLTAGLLRMQARRALDVGVVVWLAAGVAMREEFATVAALALLYVPPGFDDRLGRGRRWAAAGAMLAWLGLYWFVVRPALGDGDRADQATADLFGGGAALGYRAAVVALALTTAGGLVLRGWRFALPALPGLALVLAVSKLGMAALSFQYSMFAAPGLIAAAVAGAASLASTPLARRRAELAFAVVVSVAAHALASAAPGGGRYPAAYVDPPVDSAESRAITQARDVLDGVPPDTGLLVPTMIGAAWADRAEIWSAESLRAELQRDSLPTGLDYALVTSAEFGTIGRRLAGMYGYALASRGPGWALLASPSTGSPLMPPPAHLARGCDAPVAAWPAAGVAICDVQHAPGSVVSLSVLRVAPAAPELEATPLMLWWRGEQGASAIVIDEGLVGLGALRPNEPWAATTEQPVPAGGAVVLLDREGRRLPAALPAGGPPVSEVPLAPVVAPPQPQ